MVRSLCVGVVIGLVLVACTDTSADTESADVAKAVAFDRDTFFQGLDVAGWATYVDETGSWSVRYPQDWTVGEETVPGSRLTLMTPSMESYLVIAVVRDAIDADASSHDYLARHVEAALRSGVFRSSDGEALSLTHLDVDLDGRADPQDIVAVDLAFDHTDETAADEVGITSWYAYYDPGVRPGYAFAFETVGSDPELTRHVDNIVLSFEPPGGYPDLTAAHPVPPPPLAVLGTEVAVTPTPTGTVTWRATSSIPLDLVEQRDLPSPGHQWEYEWRGRYRRAAEATGACFEIYQESAGFLGIGPCPSSWQPDATWNAAGYREWNRRWSAFSPIWIWLRDLWTSPDGESWSRVPAVFPNSTAIVRAEPWSVAEHQGRWVVIGATGVGSDADVPSAERSFDRRQGLGLLPPIGAEPAAWVSDDLAAGWEPLFVDFTEEGTHTELTSVVGGEAGWFIFGIRSAQEEPFAAEWVAWASRDGADWTEMPMSGLDEDPCVSGPTYHCGHLKAHLTAEGLVLYAWANDPRTDPPRRGWRLLVGTFD